MKDLIERATGIICRYDVERIILFGSALSGNQKEDSDIDLLVIKDLPRESVRGFRLMLKKALWEDLGADAAKLDIMVDNLDRIKERITMGDLFYREIYMQGKTIYA